MRFQGYRALCVAGLLLAAVGSAGAETFFEDFDTGPGSELVLYKSEGSEELWDIDEDGPTLVVSKDADSDPETADDFIAAGCQSDFLLVGDFSVTVDFSLLDFPAADGTHKLNEAILGVYGDEPYQTDPNKYYSFLVLRFRQKNSESAEVYSDGPYGKIDNYPLYGGQFRITREINGDEATLTGYITDMEKGDWRFLASRTFPFTGTSYVYLNAAQGMNLGTRSTTSLSVAFDNLDIEADDIIPVPEPVSLSLLALGVPLVLRRRRRR